MLKLIFALIISFIYSSVSGYLFFSTSFKECLNFGYQPHYCDNIDLVLLAFGIAPGFIIASNQSSSIFNNGFTIAIISFIVYFPLLYITLFGLGKLLKFFKPKKSINNQ